MGAPEIQPGQSVGTIDYNQLLEAQKGGSGILIVDVREPEEINKTGKLPGSINIPSRLYYIYNIRISVSPMF